MDPFGISSAMTTALETFIQASRRTGRTTQMLDTVCNMPEGAPVAIVTPDTTEARRLMILLRERGRPDVRVFCCPAGFHKVSEALHGFEGCVVFDHLWAEEYWRRAIRQATSDFDALRKRFDRAPDAYKMERF